MSLLTAEDILKVNRFYRYINQHYESFIINAIGALNTIFNYRLTTYIVFEEKSDHTRYVSMIGSNSISHDLLQSYKESYYKKDQFLKEFRKKAHSSKSNSVFKLSDFTTMEEFSKTEFGKIMMDYNLGYYASINTAAVCGYPVYSLNVYGCDCNFLMCKR